MYRKHGRREREEARQGEIESHREERDRGIEEERGRWIWGVLEDERKPHTLLKESAKQESE